MRARRTEGRELRAAEVESFDPARGPRESRREPLRLDYIGFEVERGWVVGLGMEPRRELDFVGVVVDPRF